MRERDLSFEKLAEVCGVDITALTPTARGALNKALGDIRSATEGLDDAELAMLIEGKAASYRKVMDGALLTPTALAKHWPNLDGMLAAQQAPVTYVSFDRQDCTTCEGHKMIYAFDRDGADVFRSCPDCNPKAQEKIDSFLSYFNRNYSGGPRLPVPATVQTFGRTHTEGTA
jgi:hypothetical protein